MLGKLAKYLRILGLDAEYTKNVKSLQDYKETSDPPYFLTRAVKTVPYDRIILIKSDRAREQVQEIKEIIRPFIDFGKIMNRCIECNLELVGVQKENIEQKVPEFVFHQYGQFKECPRCGKIYWEGSHANGMAQLVRELIDPEGGETYEEILTKKKV